MSVDQLYTQIASLPAELQEKVAEYISFLKFQQKEEKSPPRISGKAKGMIQLKDSFDDPIPDFEAYQ